MRTELYVGLALAVGLGLAPAAMAQDDDWEIQEDAARRIWVAAARYDAGQMIVVQCREGGLTAVLAGLPATAGALSLQAARADGRAAVQEWAPAGAPGAYQSTSPGRAVRFMRGGGSYTLRAAEETPAFQASFDLPTQSANLDRVLTACGWATEDERDLAPVATEVSLTDPDDTPSRPRVRTTRGAPRPMSRRPETPAGPSPVIPAENGVSCVVRDLHLRECRADHPASAEERGVRETIRHYDGREVYPIGGSNAAASEGKLVHLLGGRITIIDYIATVPR